MQPMHTLIIGGSSGLGLILAERLLAEGHQVTVTGRTKPKDTKATFKKVELHVPDLPTAMEELVAGLPEVDVLIYAAGFFQSGRLTDLSADQIEKMLDVGCRGLIYSVRAVLAKQEKLGELITITSTSGWTPRQYEPAYNFVKSGATLFTSAMAEDGRIAKVMTAGPAGMDTPFWRDEPGRDKTSLLDPNWAAEQIMHYRTQNYRYKYIRIMRDPPRVEETEER